ncbi:MAG TPA: amidohydrolase family protein, partial [Candidatus Angelobacter sp.]
KSSLFFLRSPDHPITAITRFAVALILFVPMKLIFSALLMISTALSQNPPADLVLKNANIYTVDEHKPNAQAVAVKGDKIVFVGSDAEVQAYIGHGTHVLDLKGATVVPGLTDSHYHFLGVGARELTFNLEGAKSLEELLARVKERVGKAKHGEWIVGRGWIETFWTPPVFPTRSDLDKVAPDNPVVLGRADGHAMVVNSAALKLAGIDRNTPAPFGGEISKDKNGEPNGMLLDHAQELVRSKVPPEDAADPEKAAIAADQRSIMLGWCEVQDPGGSFDDVEVYKKLYQQDKLKVRIYKAVYGPGPQADRLLREGPQIGLFDHHLTLRTIKVVSDGALGSRGAALLAPYSDKPDTSGFLTVEADALRPMLISALKQGIQVQTHAIGDRANRFMLDEYERAFNAVPSEQRKVADPRWRDEHTQIVSPADLPRFAQLHVIPSMQPSHAIGDLFFAPRRLGMERLKGAYAWETLIKSGVPVPGGSDAPVERGEPMIEFYAAVARKPLPSHAHDASLNQAAWHPEEAMTREQALKAFTIWAAYAAFEEDLKGTITPGKLADFTVLSADIMKVPEPQILQTKNLMTIIGGQVVYEKK